MLKNRNISSTANLLEALKKMDELNCKLLIVLKAEKFFGLVSAGDIQRAIINNSELDLPIAKILRQNIKIAKPENTINDIKKMMFDYRMELCPVIDANNTITHVYYWEDLFEVKTVTPRNQFSLPVVIMAGGLGSRMKPLTNVLPKPLIPIGEQTIIEHIFERFNSHGSNQFFISVNYKADLIEYYLSKQKLPYDIGYVKENAPSGTAGSLSLLKNKIHSTFFVTNCDILIDQDYSEILDYHQTNQNEITIVAALKHYSIPYGTIETTENGQLVSLQEKPELTFKINSGMYILAPHLLNEIPENTFFHITHLIDKIIQRKGKVGVFPVSEKSWKDIGEWDEYLKHNLDDA